MFAGLPGTGVGGIFYLLLTLWMPFHELIRVFQGRSTKARWLFIARHWALFGVVVMTIWGQTIVMRWMIPASERQELKSEMAQTGFGALTGASTGLMATSAIMALLSLAIVLAVVHLLRVGLFVRRTIVR